MNTIYGDIIIPYLKKVSVRSVKNLNIPLVIYGGD